MFHSDFGKMREYRTRHGLCASERRGAAQGMMHQGKTDRSRPPIIGPLAVIGLVLLMETIGPALRTARAGTGTDGFRELRWGTSIEQSSMIYQDLVFERYVLPGGKEEPWKVYVRRMEHGEIENETFDSIEYWFKRDRFSRIRAVLNSRIGPRTMVTRAESAFARMSDRFMNRYGNPSGRKVDYVTEFIVVVREATWIVEPTAITIRYEGVGRTNEDLFTLTLQERRKR
jgi:hypothetical protein